MSTHVVSRLTGTNGEVEGRLQHWDHDRFAARLRAKDPTLWFDQPETELVDRLSSPGPAIRTAVRLEDLNAFGAEVAAAAVSVPETAYDCGKLVGAQLLGDHQAMRQRDRSVLQVSPGDRGATGPAALRDAVVAAARG